MFRKQGTIVMAATVVMLGACGNSDTGDKAAYCKVAKQVNEEQGPPTKPQLEQLRKDAPSEIRSDVVYVVDQLEKGQDARSVVQRQDVAPRFQKVQDYESKQCGITANNGPPSAPPEAGARPVTASAVDFKFNGVPPTATAGSYAVTLKNDGQQDHEFNLVELKPGATADQLIAASKTGGHAAEDQFIAAPVGGSGGPVSPGASKTFGLKLEAGKTYAYACFLGSPPHAFNGMYGTLTVN